MPSIRLAEEALPPPSRFTLLLFLVLSATNFGCSKKDNGPPPPPMPAPPTAEEIAAAQAEQNRLTSMDAHARTLLTVTFQKIDDRGYPLFEWSNETGRDIDTISGSFEGVDADGNMLFATGQTNAVPGEAFLRAGESIVMTPYNLQTKEPTMTLLKTQPDSVQVTFKARSLTYMDGSHEPGLEQSPPSTNTKSAL